MAGPSLSGAGASPPTIQVFDASGTWTKPVGCKAAKVTVIGPGGGGGGASGGVNNAKAGGSGGGGGMAVKLIDVTAIASETVTIGAAGTGGAAGAAGGAGGTSSFGAHCSATGGAGGVGNYGSGETQGGVGGEGTGGDINLIGERAGPSLGPSTGGNRYTRHGGSSPISAGAVGVDYNGNGVAADGVGGGGSGGSGEGAYTGGAGAAGRVIVEEFY